MTKPELLCITRYEHGIIIGIRNPVLSWEFLQEENLIDDGVNIKGDLIIIKKDNDYYFITCDSTNRIEDGKQILNMMKERVDKK